VSDEKRNEVFYLKTFLATFELAIFASVAEADCVSRVGFCITKYHTWPTEIFIFACPIRIISR
jgi:hypothetical protein